jgi:hypothetical protein
VDSPITLGESMTTDALLTERGTTHGKFEDNARYGQMLRSQFRQSKGWENATHVQREALDMIACKLARIMSGQASWPDHFRDLAGYAELAARDAEARLGLDMRCSRQKAGSDE